MRPSLPSKPHPMRELRGMTWDHSRGFDPMVATSRAFCNRHPDITIHWEKRSLQAFADRPIEEMAENYDLMVIDHPQVGEVAGSGLLLPLDGPGRDREIEILARQSVGCSHRSYQFDGRQWVLAIDAATPVAAFRPDLIKQAPTDWDEVMGLARAGKVGFALIPINALMTFMGLARNMDIPIASGEAFLDRDAGETLLEMMRHIVACMDPRCLTLDPIGIYDWMGTAKDAPAYSPFGYGYTNYSRDGYRSFSLTFADAPGINGAGPSGTVIGGTGIAISSCTAHADIAVDYALWIASAGCQQDLYFTAGGQPGNAVAWEDDVCNAATRDFFRNTRQTLETAWLRPRYDGYMDFQDRGGDIIHDFLFKERDIPETLQTLQSAYQDSRK